MNAHATGAPAQILDMVACPACGLLHQDAAVPLGHRSRCQRCHRQFYFPRKKALARLAALSLTEMILMVVAIFFPFLTINAAGQTHQSSIFETAMSFSEGLLMPLAALVLVLIILLPPMRVVALIYTIAPLMRNQPPPRYARAAFRFVENSHPWQMVEIYVVGAVVALIKVVGIAAIHFGAAFWAFSALVVVLAFKDNLMCYWTVWKLIDPDTKQPKAETA